jgi:prophage DNA circulation protein
MGWRERLLPASFRRVPFYIERTTSEFGRKNVVHEFPERDEPSVEDLGRATRRYNITGYLIGDDYLEQRDRLLSACEDQSEPGELVHPYFGALNVVCQRIQTAEDITENNMLRLTLTFVEAGEAIFPSVIKNTAALNAANKLSALTAAKNRLVEVYSLTRIQINKVNEIRANINSGLRAIQEAKLIVSSAASYRRMGETAVADIESLLNNADELADSIVDLMTFGSFPSGLYPAAQSDEYNEDNEDYPATENNSKDQFNEVKTLFEFAPTSTSDVSDAYVDFYVQAAVITAAGFVSVIEYDSLNEAEEFRDTVVDQINTLLEGNLDVELASALRDLRTSVIKDVNERGIDLARLTTYTPIESVPALVLSYDLYGTTAEEQNIIDRNKTIHHPGFVPGGAPIEVLIDV